MTHSEAQAAAAAEAGAATPVRIRELLLLYTKLGVIGFGGPAAHIALMEGETVVRRGWLDRQRFLDALAATNLVPGPNSTEMAIHIGYLRAGLAGALVSGLAFVLPAFALLLALSWAYFEYGDVPETEAIFYGLGPVVIAVVFIAAYRLGRSAVADAPLAVLFGGGLALTLLVPLFEPLVLIGAGLAGIALYSTRGRFTLRSFAAPAALVFVLAVVTRWDDTLLDLGWVFLRTGGLLFGGGYVIIPLVEHDAVERFGWLTRQQFLDGVALGQATPGPIVITATFVGYAAAGWTGAVVATAAVFLPSFVFAIVAARFAQALRRWTLGRHFLAGISAAVAGAILAAALVLAERALVDLLTVALFGVALAVLLSGRAQPLYLLAAGAIAGFAAKGGLL